MWDNVGMGRSREGLTKAIAEIGRLREAFWQDVRRDRARAPTSTSTSRWPAAWPTSSNWASSWPATR